MIRGLSCVIASCENACVSYWLPQGLHDTPQKLREEVSKKILEVENAWEENPYRRRPDAIVLGYGLCGKGISGIKAGRLPLVIPRTDDCIGLLLGSQQRYLEYFDKYKGIYWFSPGWLDSSNLTSDREYWDKKYVEYQKEFGEDNAKYLIEEETRWFNEYRNGFYITSRVCNNKKYIKKAKEISLSHNWILNWYRVI
jgi:hypothetical protein